MLEIKILTVWSIELWYEQEKVLAQVHAATQAFFWQGGFSSLPPPSGATTATKRNFLKSGIRVHDSAFIFPI